MDCPREDSANLLSLGGTMKAKAAIATMLALFMMSSPISHGAPQLDSTGYQNPQSHVPTSAPASTATFGKGQESALKSVFRVICFPTQSAGTGFLHKSGKIITAAHVVENCSNPILLDSNGIQVSSKVVSIDADEDLALIEPISPIGSTPFDLADDASPAVGDGVSMWGFPAGYFGLSPLLSTGVLAGKDAWRRASDAKIVTQWVVNAAVNHGNSGGPLIDVQSGDVIGVVVSKIAPLKPETQQIISALSNQKSGFVYTAKMADGKIVSFSEAQIVAVVLDDLREQVQLVIGHAVLSQDIKAFLRRAKVDP